MSDYFIPNNPPKTDKGPNLEKYENQLIQKSDKTCDRTEIFTNCLHEDLNFILSL